jgi:hypothetical protein
LRKRVDIIVIKITLTVHLVHCSLALKEISPNLSSVGFAKVAICQGDINARLKGFVDASGSIRRQDHDPGIVLEKAKEDFAY